MKNKPKTEILRTRVSPEERERIEYKALSSYRTVSRYLRDVALDKPIIIINGVDELADELRRVGNNLNQITRAEATARDLIDGINCTPDSAHDEFLLVKERFGKEDGDSTIT